jgi:hypothetical protein
MEHFTYLLSSHPLVHHTSASSHTVMRAPAELHQVRYPDRTHALHVVINDGLQAGIRTEPVSQFSKFSSASQYLTHLSHPMW